MTKVMADTINGVYVVDSFEAGVEVTKNENMFFDELANCGDNEQLACEVSDKMLEKIEAKYGLKK